MFHGVLCSHYESGTTLTSHDDVTNYFLEEFALSLAQPNAKNLIAKWEFVSEKFEVKHNYSYSAAPLVTCMQPCSCYSESSPLNTDWPVKRSARFSSHIYTVFLTFIFGSKNRKRLFAKLFYPKMLTMWMPSPVGASSESNS